MVESSKILTVSYGTFSCTLEGFDDSFSTMKAIAEYFRDLAAGDRYFGAEPPTPDTEMLTRIAEREISRRVEARTSDAGIVLRASDPAPQALADTDTRPAMPPAQQPPAEAPVAQSQPKAERHPDSESVADKLKRIRSVVGSRADTAFVEDLEERETPSAPAPTADDTASLADDDAPVAANPDAAASVAHDDAATTDKADTAEETVTIPEAYAAAEDDIDDETDAQIKEVLRNLERAGLRPPETPAVEDQAAVVETATARVAAQIAQDAPQQDIATPAPKSEQPAETQATAKPALAVKAEPAAAAQPAKPEPKADTAQAAAPAADRAEQEADEAAAIIQSLIAQTREASTAEQPQTAKAAPDAAPAKSDDDSQTEAPADPVEAPTAPRRGRILRVTRRPRPEAASAADAPQDDAAAEPAKTGPVSTPVQDARARLAEMRRDMNPEPREIAADQKDAPTDAPLESSLSPEDEADLQRDLAAAEAAAEAELSSVSQDEDGDDFDGDDTEETAETDAAVDDAETDSGKPEVAAAAAPQATRDALPTTSEAEMSRINAQAEEELANPENSRRRDAIAHLKAAVAATEAARQLGEPRKTQDSEETDFREDLQKAVKPRRPVADESARTERPRTAPLKLVASQRVDTPADAAEKQVQPRRVAAPAAKASDTGDFAEYAQSVGANSLQDLLEAAAAYVAIVEGAEDFSRPQIMQKVQATAKEEFTREDGLRSFGTLLRQGRIEKARAGRFQISDRTRFRPEQKAANG
ncbi:hypothetical protein SAMN05428995_102241 [Loktanella sp. DSM 29012]|uniref:hypothetical protein n=1 Tax=Loktanella sp. DSM 29012 TaxID=1881056 RepID=UPI0008CCD5CD|nr:hypothetical protein [Loktanella sp. DSM 29012]SEP99028.1 hypothetical protein SAMN05428995_102241 [Loktanella sp. DSM 29012]